MKKSMRGVIDPYGLGFLVLILGGLFINNHHDKQSNVPDNSSHKIVTTTTATARED